MTEADWWEYQTPEEMADAVAADVGFPIGQALEARGDALVAFPGGKSPLPIFEKLAKAAPLAARDHRADRRPPRPSRQPALQCGAPGAPLHVARHARRPARGGRCPGSSCGGHGRKCAARRPALAAGPGLVGHGHGRAYRSIFPGSDLQAELSAPKDRRAISVLPDPLPPEAPVARVTLTRVADAFARTLILTLSGAEKRRVLEQALEDGDASPFPLGRVLAAAEAPADIHWSPA